MIPAGYIAKRIVSKPDYLEAKQVSSIYSLSGCISAFFDEDYILHWKHNGFWLYDSPETISEIANQKNLSLKDITIFYYEVYEQECCNLSGEWRPIQPEESFSTQVQIPKIKKLQGFDVTTHYNGIGCSYLSCNHMAEQLPTNEKCLFHRLEDCIHSLRQLRFQKCSEGWVRIYSVSLIPSGLF